MIYDYYWVGMIPVGLIFVIVGLSMIRKSRLFLADYEWIDARIRKIARARGSHTGRRRGRTAVYTPYAEYTIDGRSISGKHFIPVRHGFIRFREGDVVAIKVNRQKPEMFCIDTVDGHKKYVMGIKMLVFGIVVVAGSVFILIMRM